MTSTKLIVGLGNPGLPYAGTRHNVGFEVVEHLALHEGLLFFPSDRLDGYGGPNNFLFARSHVPDVLFVQPLTWMNKSGEAVAPLVEWTGGDISNLFVVYDDLDLEPGKLRIRARGGHGGQNGMRSIINHLSSDCFSRLRVGIGRPETDAARHVLSPFEGAERTAIDNAVAKASEAVLHWLGTGDIDSTMSRFHSRWNLNV
jgi:peptidyl-tRNA hydrolase, PTH1 family